MMRAGVIISFLTIILSLHSVYALEVPYLAGRVNDNAGILSEATVNELENTLSSFEQKTSCQIAVLTIKSLEDESIEQYSIRVVESWKLGQKGKDNGVLLLVAQNDRRMRIEVGYGLEAALTDYITGRIIANEITPYFKNSDYDGGITSGINAIIKTITSGEYKSEIDNSTVSSEAQENDIDRQVNDIPVITRILIGFFIFGVLGLFTFMMLFITGFQGVFMYIFLIPFWATFPIMIVGTKGCLIILLIYLFGTPAAKLFFKKSIAGKKIFKKISKFSGSGSSSFRSSGSSSSSSGFSGGGGSFGGGGSSGSW